MKKSLLLEELVIWFRGRFSLTGEEKGWILLILSIFWVGLLARYIHLKNQTAEALSPQEVEILMMGDK